MKHKWEHKLKVESLKNKEVADIADIIEHLEQIEKHIKDYQSR